MRILPEGHAIDDRIQRDLVTTDVDEVVVTANHAGRRRHDRIGQVRLLTRGQGFELLSSFTRPSNLASVCSSFETPSAVT